MGIETKRAVSAVVMALGSRQRMEVQSCFGAGAREIITNDRRSHRRGELEEIKVPAGAFEVYRIEVYNNYTGQLFSKHWYSPKVKWFVKNKTYLPNGVRAEELLGSKSE